MTATPAVTVIQPTSKCGLWGSTASSAVNNSDTDQGTEVLDHLKIAVVLYENIIKFYFSRYVSYVTKEPKSMLLFLDVL